MALFLDVGPDDALLVGDALVSIERKSGARVRLRIEGGTKVELLRKHKLRVLSELVPPTSDSE